MAEIVLVTGGVRSGKSSFAEQMLIAEQDVVYIATCPKIDQEMDERISNHQQRREKFGWRTVEEDLDIKRHISSSSSYIIECLTLWVNNLMYEAELRSTELTEADISAKCAQLLDAVNRCSGKIIFVTNETGMGIMPINKSARLFGDLAGRCNQIIAAAADEVYLLVSGIPVKIKGNI